MQQIFACLFILLVVRASAVEPVKGVQFAKPEFAFTTGLSEAVQEFDLPFTNHTDRAIKVLSVETSCSCMKVSALDKQVEAGATSGVRCVVQIPNSIGPIQKLIILNTDAPSGGMHVVRIRVDVPGIFTCNCVASVLLSLTSSVWLCSSTICLSNSSVSLPL